MRARIERWVLPGPPLRVARRVLRHLAALRDCAPPRMAAAALSTLWNRWCTERRFQRIGPCVFGCADQADAIEHYARCPVVRRFACSFVRLAIPAPEAMQYFMLSHGALANTDVLTRTAIVIYAVYRVTERVRREPASAQDVLPFMLQQSAREAVRGHPQATQVLDGPRPVRNR